jgi:mRNA-degrading endonuclease YafQ of YafQ-DinJ toxin-antitoxin module
MKIIYTPEFRRLFKKLPKEVKLAAVEAEAVFRQNPRDPRLKLHKLNGRLAGKVSFSISFHARIIVRFADKDLVYFLSVGNHDIYK